MQSRDQLKNMTCKSLDRTQDAKCFFLFLSLFPDRALSARGGKESGGDFDLDAMPAEVDVGANLLIHRLTVFMN